MASGERIESVFDQYLKALNTLQTAVNLVEFANKAEKESYNLFRDGAIQRFEYTFEIAWKLIKRVAEFKGYKCNSPRDAFKLGYKLEIINEEYETVFLDMIEKRNLTVHTYNEETAVEIYTFIKEKAVKAFESIVDKIKIYY
jgi:nucleotidyltransferase substrate binding protein (TIGR01987 family)